MATNYKTGRIDYTTQDPKKVAQQNRQLIGTRADTLDQQAQQQAATANAAAGKTQDYLGGIENPLAQGQGGYNASETSQIQMTPEQQQQMVTGAGISAGTGTAASVGAAERAAAASGGNPLALAAYRARAAQQEGSQAGDAMTQARVAGSNAAAGRAENIGQTRIGQQNQALGYYGGLQAQQAGQAEQAYNRQQQTYGTETSGINSASQTAQSASQNPSTFDKVMGGVSGALSFLDEGDVASGATPAVVGENGPEKVVNLDFMDEGGVIPSLATLPHSADYNAMTSAPSLGTTTPNADGSLTFTAPAASAGTSPSTGTSWMQRAKNFLTSNQQQQQQQPGAPAPQQPQRTQPAATSIGQSVGKIASLFLADGGIAPQGANGIFTKPTRVNLSPNEAVVPLSYRPGAKVRPSMAALPAARTRPQYGARI